MATGCTSPGNPRRDRRFVTRALIGIVLTLAMPGANPCALSAAGPPPPDPVPGAILQWQASDAFDPLRLSAESPPDAKRWESNPPTSITAGEHGIVDLARYVARRPSGTSRAWLRTVVTVDAGRPGRFQITHVGDLSLFVNRHLVLRTTPVEGSSLTTPRSETITVPLQSGDNELFLALSDSPECWAFTCRDLDAVFMTPGMTPLWEVKDQLAAPESAVFDRARGAIYVSCFNADAIARLGPDGVVVSTTWVQGVRRPTGVALHKGLLYVAERPGIAVIDPDAGVVTARWPLPNAKFPNDVAVGEDGSVYVSDSQSNRIFRVVDGVAELWLESVEIREPNGVHVDGDRLLVGVVSEGTIKAVNRAGRSIAPLTVADSSVFTDGIVGDGRGGFLYSDYHGRIFTLRPDLSRTVVLDRRGPERYCADISYDPQTGLLLVPSFFDHRLTAYLLPPLNR